jgi:hypothetical protein
MKGNAPNVLQDKNSVVGFDMYNQASTGDVVRTLKTPLGGDDLAGGVRSSRLHDRQIRR